MERTPEELKAEMEYWQAEVKRVTERAGEAYRRHYAKERDIERNKKPTLIATKGDHTMADKSFKLIFIALSAMSAVIWACLVPGWKGGLCAVGTNLLLASMYLWTAWHERNS